jgi:hypothetical protein
MVIGQELGVRRWNIEGRVVDFKKHLKETQRENQLQIKAKKMQKVFVGPNFHALIMKMKCYKMHGVTDLPPLQESRPRDS